MFGPKISVALVMLFSGSNLSYNEEVIGLTGHCLSFYARLCKLLAAPLIAAFDLRRLNHRSNPYIRVTKQAESVMSCGGRRL